MPHNPNRLRRRNRSCGDHQDQLRLTPTATPVTHHPVLANTRSGLPRIGSLCTGYGGLDLGVAAAFGGGRLAWCADDDAHVRKILAARFPDVPNLGDITTLDWHAAEPVDVLTAGFPCQDISAAGRRHGIEKGAHSSVWFNVMEAVRVLRPGLLVVENVAALRARGLCRVLGDLAEAGYDAVWCSLRAADVGAPHRRERVFVAAHPAGARWPWSGEPGQSQGSRPAGEPERRGLPPAPSHTAGPRRERRRQPDSDEKGQSTAERCGPSPDAFGSPSRRRLPGMSVTGVAADAQGDRRDEGQPEPARLQGRPDPPVSRDTDHPATAGTPQWGPYESAIDRWRHILGRSAPPPTELGRGGRPRLSPRFVEWMMGLPDGWVTDLGLPRTAQLRALGNGVLPQQAAHAMRILEAVHDLDPDA
ncbi:DNA cytosine methyltransferase [Actinomadura sp. 7K507]|nr:DNA cytosine methyltransferase [Actinomadura sp. 7K507]